MSNINRPRTSDEIQADQWKQAGMPPRGSAAVPAPVDSDAGIDKFLNEHATGRAVFFQFKQGRYANRDGDEIAAGKELVLVYDAVLYGWIRFRGKPTGKWEKCSQGSCLLNERVLATMIPLSGS
jgi:hypothetical protein